MVEKRTLLVIAGVFWLIAGANVVAVGIGAYIAAATQPAILAALIAGSAGVFALFFLCIFKPYAAKHEARIASIPDKRVSALRFMDRKGYIMIVAMIALGAGLRLSGVVPDWFIAFVYTGLGAALALTGVLFLGMVRRKQRR